MTEEEIQVKIGKELKIKAGLQRNIDRQENEIRCLERSLEKVKRELSEPGANSDKLSREISTIERRIMEENYGLSKAKIELENCKSRLKSLKENLKTLNTPMEIPMKFNIHLDRETSDRAGAGGMFQVSSIEDEYGVDKTELVDVGTHFNSLDEVKKAIAEKLKVRTSLIELHEV